MKATLREFIEKQEIDIKQVLDTHICDISVDVETAEKIKTHEDIPNLPAWKEHYVVSKTFTITLQITKNNLPQFYCDNESPH